MAIRNEAWAMRTNRARESAINWMGCKTGEEALAGRYYTELFGYVYEQFMDGVYPTSVPVKHLDGWKLIGQHRINIINGSKK